MRDINLKQLEVFVTTAEYGSFTRAADVLYLSQSTVSSHIRSLEETLGVLLFDRAARRRVALTEAGKRIYPTAREIVDRCRALQSNLPEREGNLLTGGVSTVPAQYLIPRLLADFSRQRPGWNSCCGSLSSRGRRPPAHGWKRKSGCGDRESCRNACTFWPGWKTRTPSAGQSPAAWGSRCFLRWWWRRTRRQAACGPLNWGRGPGGRSAWYCQRELR